MPNDIPVITRNYSDNFSAKDLAYNHLAPKYFGDIDLNNRNVGLTGFTLEQIANITEDGFNTASSLIKESFAIRAQIPESIYSHAAIFQLSELFATPSECEFILILKEDDILNYGELTSSKFYQMKIDADTKITIEDRVFLLDYDIIVKAQKQLDEWIYSAQYDISHDSDISTIKNPYIKIRRTGDGFIGLFIVARQLTREVTYDNIINNTKINYPVLNIPFNNQIAGFDIFYKSPKSDKYIQLVKRIMYTKPLQTPFCYYKLSDDNVLSITFSSKELYFQPEFNSELKIVIYTTNGKSGNFDIYTGNQLAVIPSGDVYSYNENLFMVAHPLTASSGGVDKLGLDALQNLTVEGFSTARALMTEGDLTLFFNNFKYRNGSDILFIKKRDDLIERLFSAFIIMRRDDFIYPTNTLFIDTDTSEMDVVVDNNKYMIKPGHLFKYKDTSKDVVQMIPDNMAYDDVIVNNDEFLFTNPFLIMITRKPNVVGFYMNTVNSEISLDYSEINNSSFIQFIINKLSVKRTLYDVDRYHISLNVIPSIDTDIPLVNMGGSVDLNSLRIVLAIRNSRDEDTGYIELKPTDHNESSGSYTFSGELISDDYITSDNMFRCTNAIKSQTNTNDHVYVPMEDCVLGIYTLFKSTELKNSSNFLGNIDESLNEYVSTNVYSNLSDLITFIKPMNMMRSTVSFSRKDDSSTDLDMSLSSIPFIKYDIIKDTDKFEYFISQLTKQYLYLESTISSGESKTDSNDVRLSNNMHIDLKFYNTYGRSKNFIAGDRGEELDKVNMSIKFKINTSTGMRDYELIRDLKIFIKKYIEKLNAKGSNDIYISNLIREIENNFPTIHHQQFMGINNYPATIQTIRNATVDLNKLSKDERRNYVPELLVVDIDDIELHTYD